MEYVAQRNGGYYVAGTRVSLDSVVYAFRRGESPEKIQSNFDSLTVEQINGAIAFYTGNREMVDAYLVRQKEEFDRMRAEDRAKRPEFYARMAAAKQELLTRRS